MKIIATKQELAILVDRLNLMDNSSVLESVNSIEDSVLVQTYFENLLK